MSSYSHDGSSPAASTPAAWPGAEAAFAAGELLVIFRAGARRLALPCPPVQRILHTPALSRPPGLPPLMEGMLNLHGVAVPVVNAARLFGGAGTPPALHTPLIVLSEGGRLLALMADEVCGLRTATGAELVPVADTELLNDCVTGDLPDDAGTVHVLHPTRMLLAGERQRLAELQDLAQARLDALHDDECD
jgi:purine-binding chemotaxis protein CheW